MGPGGERALVEDSAREVAGFRIERHAVDRCAMQPSRVFWCSSGAIMRGASNKSAGGPAEADGCLA
jgi:hypothetical protein